MPNAVVVSPDIGALRRARNFAESAGSAARGHREAAYPRRRKTEIWNLIGDVRNKNVIIVDDEIDTAGTLVKAVNFIKDQGALDICACATHAVFSEPAVDRIRDSVLDGSDRHRHGRDL